MTSPRMLAICFTQVHSNLLYSAGSLYLPFSTLLRFSARVKSKLLVRFSPKSSLCFSPEFIRSKFSVKHIKTISHVGSLIFGYFSLVGVEVVVGKSSSTAPSLLRSWLHALCNVCSVFLLVIHPYVHVGFARFVGDVPLYIQKPR